MSTEIRLNHDQHGQDACQPLAEKPGVPASRLARLTPRRTDHCNSILINTKNFFLSACKDSIFSIFTKNIFHILFSPINIGIQWPKINFANIVL
jgi:hypothetical protein